MEENRPGFSSAPRADNDNRKRPSGPPIASTVPSQPKRPSVRQRWNAIQLSKTTIAWLCLAMIAGTMLVGFTWGGWVTAGTAEHTATSVASDAVIQRLTTICVAQFEQDTAKNEKLAELKTLASYQQRNFVRDQGWATMPGDEESNNQLDTGEKGVPVKGNGLCAAV